MSEVPLHTPVDMLNLRCRFVNFAATLKYKVRFRAKRGKLSMCQGLLPESQGLDCLVCAAFARQRMYLFLSRNLFGLTNLGCPGSFPVER